MATIERTVTKTGSTKRPNGLTLKRAGMGFVCSWKVLDKDHDGGQQLQWRTNLSGGWQSYTIAYSTRSITIFLTAADYCPTTADKLKWFRFRVRGKRGRTTETTTKTSGSDTIRTTTITTYNWSDWWSKEFSIDVPYRPSLAGELDSENDNVSAFSWDTTVNNDDHRPFVNVEYQTILRKACTETDGSKLAWSSSNSGWGTGTGSASGSITRTEDSTALANDSYTRWVRVRSRGAGGRSDWRYAKHVYAMPYQAVIDTKASKTYAKLTSGSTTTCRVEWTSPSNAAHPIDSSVVQYLIGTPAGSGLAPPSTGWSEGAAVADTSGTDAVQFAINDRADADECLWVRVVNIHDRNERPGAAVRLMFGALEAPTNLSVVTDSSTHRATITATNNSDVPDSRLAVIFRREGQTDYVCGYIPHGDTSVTVQLPNWGSDVISFGVYAFQGSLTSSRRADNTTQYAVTANMKSSELWDGGDVPQAPGNLTAAATGTEGEVLLTWSWSWKKADMAEVSWSTNPNAWESTDEPQTYLMDNTRAAKIRVSGLEMGRTWYFRARLAVASGDDTTYGPYCDAVACDLSTVPATPVLALSEGVATRTKTITASWTYSSADGMTQTHATLQEVMVSGDTVTAVGVIKRATTAHSVNFKASTAGWATGTTHYLRVRVTSAGGQQSEWSDPVPVTIAEPPACAISATSLRSETITDDEDNERTVTALTAMPLTVTVTGAGEGGSTTLVIERAEDYQMDRPDEGTANGFEGEAVYITTQPGEGQITVNQADLIGHLDDGAQYRIVATVQDGLGQSAEAEQAFEVHWDHQAIMPTASITMDADNFAALITPEAPENTQEGDVCDIYRLSADKPELIVSGGTWGTQYVDPYPAIGQFGGHRVVFRTANGDYITADNRPAWVDGGEGLDTDCAIIDFDGERLLLEYNLSLSNGWEKDFQETKYLGGAVQGDWNPAVSRSGSLGAVAIDTTDAETIASLRRLASYPGICHVRTPEGSSFAADIQVSEDRDATRTGHWANFSLRITRVDPEGFDGLTYEEWAGDDGGYAFADTGDGNIVVTRTAVSRAQQFVDDGNGNIRIV